MACGGAIGSVAGGEDGYWFEPTVLTSAAPQMRIAQEEIFGPVTAVIAVDGLEEAIDVANSVPYGLSTSVYTQNVTHAFRAIEGISTGLVYVNGGHHWRGDPAALWRHAGDGQRASGSRPGRAGHVPEWKTVYVDYSGKLQRAQMD